MWAACGVPQMRSRRSPLPKPASRPETGQPFLSREGTSLMPEDRDRQAPRARPGLGPYLPGLRHGGWGGRGGAERPVVQLGGGARAARTGLRRRASTSATRHWSSILPPAGPPRLAAVRWSPRDASCRPISAYPTTGRRGGAVPPPCLHAALGVKRRARPGFRAFSGRVPALYLAALGTLGPGAVLRRCLPALRAGGDPRRRWSSAEREFLVTT